MSHNNYIESMESERDYPYQGVYLDKSKSRKLDYVFFMGALRKNKWLIAFFTAIVTAAAGYYAYTATPIYASHATLLIESQKPNIISVEDLVSSEQESLDYYGTQFVILRSRSLAERVIRELQLDKNNAENQLMATATPLTGLRLIFTDFSQKLQSGVSTIGQKLGFSSNSTNPDVMGNEVATADPLIDGQTAQGGSIKPEDLEFNELVARFRQSLFITPVKTSKLVKITFMSPDAKFAAVAANTVAQQYISSGLDSRRGMKDQASEWMNGRIAELKEKLDKSEQALLDYKEENGLIDLNGGVGRLNEQELLMATTELASARSELSDARDRYREIQKLKESSPALLEVFPAVQNDLLVRSVKIEFGQRQRELDELENRYGSKHPKIVDAKSRLESLRSTLDGHIDRIMGSIENDYVLRQQRVASLEASLLRGKEDIQVIGQKKIILEAMEREVASNREQYNRLFNRITETDTTAGLDAANAVLAEAALVAGGPVKPNKQLILGLAVLGSLALAIAFAILYELQDDTVKSTDDVERRLGTKLVGLLPLYERGFMEGKNVLPLTPMDVLGNKGVFAEAVKSCRTTLSLNQGPDLQVILVTSSVPDEGKSTAALNLAYSFGQLERTLLIDCDLRRPSLAKALGLPQNIDGLSSLLMLKSTAEECIRRDVMDSIDCLTSGPIPDAPLEMLASARFAGFLEQLRQHYDKIIIDSAPSHSVSDFLVLSKLSDTVLYIVKSHDTAIPLVESGLSRLAEVGASVAGVWMSQVDVYKLASYGGFDFHGYYDYYGYSENSGNSSEVKLSSEEMRVMRSVDGQSELDLSFFNKMPSGGILDEFELDSESRSINDDYDTRDEPKYKTTKRG